MDFLRQLTVLDEARCGHRNEKNTANRPKRRSNNGYHKKQFEKNKTVSKISRAVDSGFPFFLQNKKDKDTTTKSLILAQDER